MAYIVLSVTVWVLGSGIRVECEKIRSYLANFTPLLCVPSDRGDNGQEKEKGNGGGRG